MSGSPPGDEPTITGGCQCGAVRYRVERLGRASICHCRMCQKAFGNFFGPLVIAEGLTWTRGERSVFHSSNRNWRGFCSKCGTPLTYEFKGGIELAIGSLDRPEVAAPAVQINFADRCRFTEGLFDLPEATPTLVPDDAEGSAGIVSYQHPDHDTED